MPAASRPAATRRIAARLSPVVGSDGPVGVAAACVAVEVPVALDPLDPLDPVDPLELEPDPELEPPPLDPEPVDPEPVDPEPVDPRPLDPEPVDPEPLDPRPLDPVLLDPCTTIVPCMNG
jgi:hypothetical protein